MKNNKKQSEVSSFFILLDVLKWNLVNPLWFLIKSKITFKKFKKDIKLDLPEDFINSSGFLAWLYIRLKKDVGQERAFEIIRDGVLKLGLAVQQVNLKNVEEKKIFENLKKNQQLDNKKGSTKLNIMEIVEDSENKYEFRVTRCLFYELFTYLQVPELTSVMCSIDNVYLSEKLVFYRDELNKTLVQGNRCCEFVIYLKK